MEHLQDFEDEFESEYFDEEDMDEPVEGICFHVMTEFNLMNKKVQSRLRFPEYQVQVQSAQPTHPEAMKMADVFAGQISRWFHGASIKRISPELCDDEFHLYIVDKNHTQIAKIGIIGEDYRDRTIH